MEERLGLSGPLAGVRVLECTSSAAGAAAGMHLCDLGADVVALRPSAHGRTRAPEWLTWDRGKRIVPLDDPELDEHARSMSDLADIVIVDATPDSLRRRRLDFDHLAQHGDPIHLWMPPTGTTGAWSELPADPILIAAVTAIASHQSNSEKPEALRPPIVESVHGLLGACGAIASLLARERGVRDCRQVVVSGLHAAAALQTVMVVDAASVVRSPKGPDGGLPNFRPYRCGDGSWVFLAALSQPFFLRALDVLDAFDVMVMPGVQGEFTKLFDPDLARQASQLLASRFTEMSGAQAVEVLRAAGVPVAPVQTERAWTDSDTVRENALFERLTDPRLGEIRMPPVAADLARTPARVVGLARTLQLDDIGWQRGARSPQPGRASASMPLAGVRVLDLGAFVASPFAGSILCDMGADVVKIEPPSGDAYRVYGASFVAVHQGKRGISIDLKSEDGKRQFSQLVAQTDVVIHNFRPSARDRLGIDATSLLEGNARLIVCELSAWGERGALRDDPAFDPLLQARAGLMHAQGDAALPRLVRLPVHDTCAACMLALGALAALYARERIGVGQRVSTSMVAASLVLRPEAFTIVPSAFQDPSSMTARSRFRGYHRCSDGWIAVGELAPHQEAQLCAVIALNCTSQEIAAADLSRAFASVELGELVEKLHAIGIPAARVLDAHAEYADGFLIANDYMHTIDDSAIGPCTVMQHYMSFVGAEHVRGPAPALGEHNAFFIER